MGLVLLISCSDIENVGQVDRGEISNNIDDWYLVDTRKIEPKRPLGDSVVIVEIPSTGIDTVIKYEFPGIFRNLEKIESKVLDYAMISRLYVSAPAMCNIPVSYSNEPYIWKYGTTELSLEGFDCVCANPAELQVKAEPNISETEKIMAITIVFDYRDPLNYIDRDAMNLYPQYGTDRWEWYGSYPDKYRSVLVFIQK